MKFNPMVILLFPAIRIYYWYKRVIRPVFWKIAEPTPRKKMTTLSEWDNSEQVSVIYGKLRGRKHNDTWNWRGIPYAKPPIGELRWRYPQETQAWRGVRKADQFRSESAQIVPIIGKMGSEDCLYLNIWRPMTSEKKLPVYFYIHGGGNTIGAGSTRDFHGYNLAKKGNLLFISLNYRLGVMGWMVHPAINREGKSGNFATLDLIQALKWVKTNITAFGGDPDNITVAGESAGAMNTTSLLASPLAKGLFHKAVLESSLSLSFKVDEAREQTEKLLINLLIDDKTVENKEQALQYIEKMDNDEIEHYLRSKKSFTLLKAIPAIILGMGGWKTIFKDGEVIPKEGYEVFSTDNWNKVPILIGVNKNEANLFRQFTVDNMDDPLEMETWKYRSIIWRITGLDYLLDKMKRSETVPPIYAYRFDWGALREDGTSVLPKNFGETMGAFHYSEVPFFHGVDTSEIFFITGSHFTKENELGRKKLSDQIMTYLSNFVKTGNPNGENLKEWKSSSGQTELMVFDADEEEIRLSSDTERYSVDRLNEIIKNEYNGKDYEKIMENLSGYPPFGFKGMT